jgi:hypothetical protein
MTESYLLPVLILFACLGVFFGSGFLAAFVAHGKGYRPWFWLLALGPVGLLLLLIKPPLRSAATPEERERWERRADWTGGILSVGTFFLLFALPAFALFGFASFRVARVAPPPATGVPPTATAPPVQAGFEGSAKPQAGTDQPAADRPQGAATDVP